MTSQSISNWSLYLPYAYLRSSSEWLVDQQPVCLQTKHFWSGSRVDVPRKAPRLLKASLPLSRMFVREGKRPFVPPYVRSVQYWCFSSKNDAVSLVRIVWLIAALKSVHNPLNVGAGLNSTRLHSSIPRYAFKTWSLKLFSFWYCIVNPHCAVWSLSSISSKHLSLDLSGFLLIVLMRVVSRYSNKYFWRFSSVLKWDLIRSIIIRKSYDLLIILL